MIPGVGLTLRLMARGRRLLRLVRVMRLLGTLLPVMLLPYVPCGGCWAESSLDTPVGNR